jgi:hypothetical protein
MSRMLLPKVLCLILIIGIPGSIIRVMASQPEPRGPHQDVEGEWVSIAETGAGEMLASTGGPDDFGYTWDDNVPFDWVDATNGIDTGLSGGLGSTLSVGPISLPFAFNFYEKTYTEVYINSQGYITFSPWMANYRGPVEYSIPNPNSPDDIIAPLWSYYTLAENGPANRVYYKVDGVAPNRRFIVEWYQVRYSYPPGGGITQFTFEVILYENNSDIRFQYQSLSGSYYCSDVTLGIESWHGYDGLPYLGWCQIPVSNTAVHFTRPADSARLQILNSYQGTFTRPNLELVFPIKFVNTGTIGPDTYKLTSTSTWPINFYNTTGIPLSDTNADGFVDTGEIPSGELAEIIVKVQTPTVVNPGDSNPMPVTFTSSLNPLINKVATLQAAVPVPFAQSTDKGGIELYQVRPEGQQSSFLPNHGYDIAIAEAADQGFVYTWNAGEYINNIRITEIWYALFDRQGLVTRPAGKIADLTGSTMQIYDSDPTVAVAPDGSIGITWVRWQVNSSGLRNHNIYFTILNPAGNITHGPTSLTNDNTWTNFDELSYSGAVIATTENNRFTLAWCKRTKAATNDYVSDIIAAIYNTAGVPFLPPTTLTNDSAGGNPDYLAPSVTGLTNSNVLLTYSQEGSSYDDVWYQVLDSNGNTIRSATNLSNNGGAINEVDRADAAQLTSGRIVVAWDTYNDTRYAVLDSSYNLFASPMVITHPAVRYTQFFRMKNFSIAADPTGHAVLTWMDADWNASRRLYYALINDDGSLRTPPMIYRSQEYSIHNGTTGYGNTSYSFSPTTQEADGYIQAPAVIQVAPNSSVAVPVQFGNLGASSTGSLVITATLSSAVDYLGDTSGINPTIGTLSMGENMSSNGGVITWEIPASMDFLGAGRFDLLLGLDDVDLGTTHLISLEISTLQNDELLDNNSYQMEIKAMAMLYFPAVVK